MKTTMKTSTLMISPNILKMKTMNNPTKYLLFGPLSVLNPQFASKSTSLIFPMK